MNLSARSVVVATVWLLAACGRSRNVAPRETTSALLLDNAGPIPLVVSVDGTPVGAVPPGGHLSPPQLPAGMHRVAVANGETIEVSIPRDQPYPMFHCMVVNLTGLGRYAQVRVGYGAGALSQVYPLGVGQRVFESPAYGCSIDQPIPRTMQARTRGSTDSQDYLCHLGADGRPACP